MVVGEWKIKRMNIPSYFSDENIVMINFWSKTRLHNTLPFSGGWMEQPAYIMDGIEALEEEWRKRRRKKR